MSIGLRDQLLLVYAFHNDSQDGWARNAYEFTAEWWGSVRQPTANEAVVAGQRQETVDVVIALSDEATIDSDAIVRVRDPIRGTDTIYNVTGVTFNRRFRELQLMGVEVSDEVYDAIWNGDVANIEVTDVAEVIVTDVATVLVTDVAELTPLTLT
jgi:hypothetical protein